MIEIELWRISTARVARIACGRYLHPEDDARRTLVRFTNYLPDHEEARYSMLEYQNRPPTKYGQTPLTAYERSRIDFRRGRSNVFHARSCKAIAHGKGESDWLGYYDPTLSVDEHREVYEQSRMDATGFSGSGGQRMNVEYDMGWGVRA